jgi:hypothetical protein
MLHRSGKIKRSHSHASHTLNASKSGYTSANISYIVVHSTGTKPDMLLSDLDKLPYHYLITKAGKLLNLKPVQSTDGTIEIALVGGLDREGNRVDCRTPQQDETLFNTLVLVTERYLEAKIMAADKLYVYSFPNPGFNVQQWIASYIPEFLRAA